MTKCVSTCKQFPKDDCNAPRCRYIDGSQRQYCRLSYKYKMLKPSCKITRKYKKGEAKAAAENKIKQFLNRSERVIKTVCSNSGQCLAFGNKISEINSLFKGFTEFQYTKGVIRSLGKPSANGFVKEITYERNGYKSFAILKSSRKSSADNLVYEYVVGTKFINRMIRRFPCFLETYGLYYYKTPDFWDRMQQLYPIQVKFLNELELQDKIDYARACQESKYAAILIQHIDGAQTLSDYMRIKGFTDLKKYDLLYILFIIYHALSSISTEFTHYDLHQGNVMVYEPVPGKFIQYQYHLTSHGRSPENPIIFYSPYIPKIIDYGRSFFNNGNANSDKVYHAVCNTPECPKCGEKKGFGWLDPQDETFLTCSVKNESYDLRLLFITYMTLTTSNGSKPGNETYKKLISILKRVKFGMGIRDITKKGVGTKENLQLVSKGNWIYNVGAAFTNLKEAVLDPNIINENEMRYSNNADQIGILHIYDDGRPMRFE